MSNYSRIHFQKKMQEARSSDFTGKAFLTDYEGAVYTGVSRSTFRRWAAQIGCRRKIGSRLVNDRAVIDQALKRGDALEG